MTPNNSVHPCTFLFSCPISSFFLPLHTDVINKNYSEYEAKEVWQKYQYVTKFMGVLWMAVKIIVLLI